MPPTTTIPPAAAAISSFVVGLCQARTKGSESQVNRPNSIGHTGSVIG